ncbi:MAG TPA: AraC family transcriptional regulator [Rhodanobacteraceae bacterium]|nr:AraC family transcriptional regulator [Rhodanobacteraceae bacterium]
MHIASHYLGPGSRLVLSPKAGVRLDDSLLACVVGGGRGCTLRIEPSMAGVWIPLRGRVQLATADAEVDLAPRDLRVTEAGTCVQATGRGNALWVGLIGGRAAWRNALGGVLEIPTPEPLLLPACHPADRDLRRRAIALVRAAVTAAKREPTADAMVDASVAALMDSIFRLQNRLSAAIARCPGRTYAQRRQVFLRLQRVRNHLAVNCHLDLDNDALARMASYSPWHFIRAFRVAYGETPHAYLVRQRLERAHRLLHGSPLAIAEVALASGFENRCAFSRLFRQRFGTTAGAVRRQAAKVPPLATAAVR